MGLLWSHWERLEPLEVLEQGHGTSRAAGMGFRRPSDLVSHHSFIPQMCPSGRPLPWESPVVAAQSRTPEKTLHHLSSADNVHGSHGRQVCRRHELYVSFQDLGWLVISTLLLLS